MAVQQLFNIEMVAWENGGCPPTSWQASLMLACIEDFAAQEFSVMPVVGLTSVVSISADLPLPG